MFGRHGRQRKAYYDRLVQDLPLADGERIYRRERELQGRNKIMDSWGGTVYQVVVRQGLDHVYIIECEPSRGAIHSEPFVVEAMC